MRGVITNSRSPGGLRLADDLPEPRPAANELVVSVRAFSINAGEVSLIEQRPDGWRPGQDTAGVVSMAAADGSGPPAGTRVVAYPADARQIGAHVVTWSLEDTGLGPFHLVLDAVGGDVLRQAIRLAAPGAEIVLYGNRTADAFAAMARREFRGKAVLTVPPGGHRQP